MKIGTTLALSGGVLAAVAATFGISWWNALLNDKVLTEQSTKWAAEAAERWHVMGLGKLGPTSPRTKLVSRTRLDENEMVTFDVVVPRTFVEVCTGEQIAAKGEWKGTLVVYISRKPGNWNDRPPSRPTFQQNQTGGWQANEDEAEREWTLLDSDPASAAFDSRILYVGTNASAETPVVYLSALRRLKLWKAAADFAMANILGAPGSLSPKWRERQTAELQAVCRGPVSEVDRKWLEYSFPEIKGKAKQGEKAKGPD
jgi:hypothetical protein